ncbi:LLM class flavin-dependent oxidoreductase [Pseudonocardia sp. KRD-291]|nr:LLM class flavin-dependent oxidoreductase [Pseudonocardia sp. KRD291]
MRAAVDAAVAAEEAGFDDVWVAEHHFMTYGLCPSAVTLAGYLLGATSRITVGTAVSVLPTAHPVALAEQALLLDQVSGGRFRLGVGRGGPWVDLEVFGTGADRHGEAGFAEALDLLLATLDGPTVSADGDRFRFREVPVTPAPRPGTAHGGVAPVLAATSPSGIAAAARRGLPMLLGMHADDAEKARFTAGYRAAGGPGVAHVAAGIAHVEDTTARARAVVRDSLPRWLEPGLAGYVRLDGAARAPRDPAEYTELLCGLHPVGDAAHAVATLAGTARATGVEHVVLLTDCTGDPARTRENIARLGAEVLPHLPGRSSPVHRPAALPLLPGP